MLMTLLWMTFDGADILKFAYATILYATAMIMTMIEHTFFLNSVLPHWKNKVILWS